MLHDTPKVSYQPFSNFGILYVYGRFVLAVWLPVPFTNQLCNPICRLRSFGQCHSRTVFTVGVRPVEMSVDAVSCYCTACAAQQRSSAHDPIYGRPWLWSAELYTPITGRMLRACTFLVWLKARRKADPVQWRFEESTECFELTSFAHVHADPYDRARTQLYGQLRLYLEASGLVRLDCV